MDKEDVVQKNTNNNKKKEDVVHMFNGILLNHKKERNNAIAGHYGWACGI